MRFFFDACISPVLLRSLCVIAERQGFEMIHLSEKFESSSVTDVEWFSTLGREGDWIVISADPRITRAKAERAAWEESGLTAFFFSDGWSSQSIYDQAADLFRLWPKIVENSRRHPSGYGFLIHKKAKDLQVIYGE